MAGAVPDFNRSSLSANETILHLNFNFGKGFFSLADNKL